MLQKTGIANWGATCKTGMKVFYKEEIKFSTHYKFYDFLTPDVTNMSKLIDIKFHSLSFLIKRAMQFKL